MDIQNGIKKLVAYAYRTALIEEEDIENVETTNPAENNEPESLNSNSESESKQITE